MDGHDVGWKEISENLQGVIRSNIGPLTVGDVAWRYKRVTGFNFYLHGRKLRDCIATGLLRGISIYGNSLFLKKQKMSETGTAMFAQKPPVPRTPTPKPGAVPSSQDFKNPQAAPPTCPGFHLVYDETSWCSAIRAISNTDSKIQGEILPPANNEGEAFIALRVEGTALGMEAGMISLIEVAFGWSKAVGAIIFDVVNLDKNETGRQLLRDRLCPLLQDTETIKVVHDFSNPGIALKLHFGQDLQIPRTLDTQIAFEALHGKIEGDFDSILKAFALKGSKALAIPSAGDGLIDGSKPVSVEKLVHASRTGTSSMIELMDGMEEALVEGGEWDNVMKASSLRTKFAMDKMLHSTRRMTFRNSSRTRHGEGSGRLIGSYELKKSQVESSVVKDSPDLSSSAPTLNQDVIESAAPLSSMMKRLAKRIMSPEAIDGPNSPKELLELIPEAFLQEHLSDRHTTNLQDLCEVVLDEGTRPYAQMRGRGRMFLVTDESIVVLKKHIDKVVGKLERKRQFGADNRAGFPGKLHRISVMRDKAGAIYGATLRVGRFFPGSAGIIDDFLFHASDVQDSPERPPSILILGEAGSGKTTAIRDICRKISAFETLVVVDTSNEIAGAGRTPHREAIGLSRRIMVADKSNQHRVMIEALQNHTPRTIVVDEISNSLEARACQDIKARGVRLVASAHGDLESMLKNPSLNTLLGGTMSVTFGDTMAKATGGNKVQTQRAGIPVFDTIIQLQRSEVNTWFVVRNVAPAVDALLSGGTYEMERRTRIVDDEHKGLESGDVVFLLQRHRQERKRQRFY